MEETGDDDVPKCKYLGIVKDKLGNDEENVNEITFLEGSQKWQFIVLIEQVEEIDR